MTKIELEEKIKEQEERISELENDVDYWIKEYDNLDEINEDLNKQIEDLSDYSGIKDLDNLIYKLKLNNLYTTELENFLIQYLKYEQ